MKWGVTTNLHAEALRGGCRWKGKEPVLTPPTHNEFLILTADGKTICPCESKQRTCHIETGRQEAQSPMVPFLNKAILQRRDWALKQSHGLWKDWLSVCWDLEGPREEASSDRFFFFFCMVGTSG